MWAGKRTVDRTNMRDHGRLNGQMDDQTGTDGRGRQTDTDANRQGQTATDIDRQRQKYRDTDKDRQTDRDRQ